MSGTARFSVSLADELLRRFDRTWQAEGLPTRSEAVVALMRRALVEQEWRTGREVAGSIILVYDHHQRNLTGRLTDVQHDFEGVVVAAQHAHLDHDNCLESIIVRGRARDIRNLVRQLKSVKGLKHVALMMTTTGRRQ
jgi:CopG family nickel-responsive transcriptional regulator